MIETLQKINKIVPNLTVSQLIELVNIVNGSIDNMAIRSIKDIPHNGLISIDTNDNKTTFTGNSFSISSYL